MPFGALAISRSGKSRCVARAVLPHRGSAAAQIRRPPRSPGGLAGFRPGRRKLSRRNPEALDPRRASATRSRSGHAHSAAARTTPSTNRTWFRGALGIFQRLRRSSVPDWRASPCGGPRVPRDTLQAQPRIRRPARPCLPRCWFPIAMPSARESGQWTSRRCFRDCAEVAAWSAQALPPGRAMPRGSLR